MLRPATSASPSKTSRSSCRSGSTSGSVRRARRSGCWSRWSCSAIAARSPARSLADCINYDRVYSHVAARWTPSRAHVDLLETLLEELVVVYFEVRGSRRAGWRSASPMSTTVKRSARESRCTVCAPIYKRRPPRPPQSSAPAHRRLDFLSALGHVLPHQPRGLLARPLVELCCLVDQTASLQHNSAVPDLAPACIRRTPSVHRWRDLARLRDGAGPAGSTAVPHTIRAP